MCHLKGLGDFYLKDVVGIHKGEKIGVTMENIILHCDNREKKNIELWKTTRIPQLKILFQKIQNHV